MWWPCWFTGSCITRFRRFTSFQSSCINRFSCGFILGLSQSNHEENDCKTQEQSHFWLQKIFLLWGYNFFAILLHFWIIMNRIWLVLLFYREAGNNICTYITGLHLSKHRRLKCEWSTDGKTNGNGVWEVHDHFMMKYIMSLPLTNESCFKCLFSLTWTFCVLLLVQWRFSVLVTVFFGDDCDVRPLFNSKARVPAWRDFILWIKIAAVSHPSLLETNCIQESPSGSEGRI